MATTKSLIPHGTLTALIVGFSILAGSSLVLFGCGATHTTTASPEPALAVVVIESTPAEIKLFVDGAFYGDSSRWIDRTVPIPSGSRRLEVRADGFYPHRRDITLESERSYTLHVDLVPLLE